MKAVTNTNLTGLECVHRGKVRDSYALDDQRMLIIATDRLSAYDVVLPDPIPGKGIVLTEVSNFWFERTQHIIANHLTGIDPACVLPNPDEHDQVDGRGVVVKRLRPLPVEAVVRGYLIGSGYRDYLSSGSVCGIKLPTGLRMAEQLRAPLFTPATKAAVGDHDENISFEVMCDTVGQNLAEQVREVSIALYLFAVEYAALRGIIIADTKFEFGLDDDDNLILMDEVLTPDSSRFWPADGYEVGTSPLSYDKQFVRDYLDTLSWDKTPPGPNLPNDILTRTVARYEEAKVALLDGAPPLN
ncbi:MAG: phosphoribosylaminoimidazolesuccinocarboxamide synthase [Gammaproteobacteria bacterium]